MAVDTQQLLDEDEAFLDLALADDELMRAEFDALISACWEAPYEPPLDNPCPPAGGWSARPPSRKASRPSVPLGLVTPRRPAGRARGPPKHRATDAPD